MSQPNEPEDCKNASTKSLSYQDVAAKLLNDRLLLSALELHTELLESGKEIRLLKDFFSNPGNFELHTHELPALLSRSGSQATLDSLDLTRYSEDGEQNTDERVAVLEFQLRKAKETINALRNNLTVATESENSTPNKTSIRHQNTDSIKPHEQRALNYLINEYLLLHGYKLTSITFADENENQDFEDWDDVGLNIAKPAELLAVYREGLRQSPHNTSSLGCQTDLILKNEQQDKKIEDLISEIQTLKTKTLSLESQLKLTQNENLDYKKRNELLLCNQKNYESINEISKQNVITSSKNSTIGSNSPEHFEIIEKSSANKSEDGLVALDDNISSNSLNETDWSDVTVNTDENFIESIQRGDKTSSPFDYEQKCRDLSHGFKEELLTLCPVSAPVKMENEILEAVLKHGVTNENLVQILSESLLRIIPNIILNKREEAIPLLIGAVNLGKNSSLRDKLLQQLFNLKKKPTECERALILTGVIGIAKFSKESRVENEILPQCWEQLTHKYVERRLLVAESCKALIPFVSESIRNSLILSMLQQMLEDREDVVRDSVVRAVSLVIALCDDNDKFRQCYTLAFNLLKDTSPIVVNSNCQILYPVLAKWALEIDHFDSPFMKNLLHKLNDYLKMTKSESPMKMNHIADVILKLLTVLDHLLPFVLVYVANNYRVVDNIEKDMAIELRPELLTLCTNLTNPSHFLKSDFNVGMILYEFDKMVTENSKVSWLEMDWLIDNVIPDLLNNLGHLEISQHVLLHGFVNLFSHMCVVFGKNFTKQKIRPIFHSRIENLEQVLSSFNQYCPSLNIIPVYLVSVLSYCDSGEEVATVLKRFLCALPLCGIPLDCLEITVKGLCLRGLQDVVVTSLWDGVVHQRPLVRASAAGLFSSVVGMCDETLLSAKVTPAIVTLANDSDILVRTATVPALGSLISDCSIKELHDKAYMQLETFLSDVNLLENHTVLRQLIVTMGNIVITCRDSFRREVIYPKLHSLSTYTYQMSNQTRKVDMTAALVDAFTKVLFSGSLDSQNVVSLILPGLRYLEAVIKENPSLSCHRDCISSMIKDLEGKLDMPLHQTDKPSKTANQSVDEVRQRVSKIFNNPAVTKSTTLPNLQGIFKKK